MRHMERHVLLAGDVRAVVSKAGVAFQRGGSPFDVNDLQAEELEAIDAAYREVKYLVQPFEHEGGAAALIQRCQQFTYTGLPARLRSVERIEDTNAFLARIESTKTGRVFVLACEADIREAEQALREERDAR